MKDANRRPSVALDGELGGLEAAFQAAFDLCEEGICLLELNGDLCSANRCLWSWLQRMPDPTARQSIWDWLSAAEESGVRVQLARLIHGETEQAAFACQFTAEDGTPIPVEVRVRSVVTEGGTLLAMAIRRKSPESMAAGAPPATGRIDPLTGLLDREALMSRLNMMLARSVSGTQRFAVLFIDVDEYKQVNDGHGHLVGDRVLQEVARRLAACVRTGDHLARFGGDEFVILVDGIVSSGGGARAVVNRIRAAFREPFALPDGEATMSVSVGVAEPSTAGESAEDLLAAADQAMYAAKRSGN
jgi:diguanylate cyclase (GGDEF)-like protein